MNIGLAYDLRSDYLAMGYSDEATAEFDRPDTIDAIERALVKLGHTPDRIGNIFSLVKRLAAGDRWDLVFTIAEGMHGYAREAQVPALLEAFTIPVTFSDPMVLSLSLHKGMAKRVVRDQGVATPDFAVVADREGAEKVRLPFPLFVKPVAEGTGKGVTAASKAISRPALIERCCDLIAAYHQPVLVEAFLPGREFTVGIVGTGREARSLGVMEVVLLPAAEKDVYSYANKEKCEALVEYRLADDHQARQAAETAVAAWRALECRDAGRVDLRCDANGVPNFIEVNPLAGLHPEHSDLPILCGKVGIAYDQLIGMIMESALKRMPGH
jgi:D-alanine-D-alanine ligase